MQLCSISTYIVSYFVQVAISSENPYVMGRFCGSFGFVLELTDTNFSGFILSPGSLNVAIFSAPGRQYKKLRSFVQKNMYLKCLQEGSYRVFAQNSSCHILCRWPEYCPKIPMCWPDFEGFQLAPTGLSEWKKPSWCFASQTMHCK